MIKKLSKILFCPLLAILLLQGCGKGKKFNTTPHLEWRGAEIVDSEGNRREILLTTYFTDGDGDIGRETTDSPCDVDSYDFLIRYFEKVNGSFKEIQPKSMTPPDDCQPFHNVLPNITPEGQNKTLEGELTVTFSYLGFPQNGSQVDSVRFELQLVDRGGHKSEVVTSPSIFIPE